MVGICLDWNPWAHCKSEKNGPTGHQCQLRLTNNIDYYASLCDWLLSISSRGYGSIIDDFRYSEQRFHHRGSLATSPESISKEVSGSAVSRSIEVTLTSSLIEHPTIFDAVNDATPDHLDDSVTLTDENGRPSLFHISPFRRRRHTASVPTGGDQPGAVDGNSIRDQGPRRLALGQRTR